MTLIVLVAIIWGASALVRAAKENKRRREEAARSDQIKRMQREYQRQRAESAEWTRKQIEMEREQMRIAKEQERERKEREAADANLAREQERQAALLEKHEKRIADLEFRMSQAESDIEFLKDRIAQLDAQRDYLLLQQYGTVPGGKEHTKYQAKIISIENQIHTAENKLSKAQHTRDMAKKEIEAE